MSLFDIFTKKQQSNTESYDLPTIVQNMFDENGITPHRLDNMFITDIDGVYCSYQTVLKCDSANPMNLFIYASFPIPIPKHVSDIVTLEIERLNERNKQVKITIQERDGEYSVFAYALCKFEKAPTTEEIKTLMIQIIDAMDNDNFRSIACTIFGFASYKKIEKAMISNARIEGREANIQMEDGYRMLHEHSEGITSSRNAGRLLVFASHTITDRISQEHAQQLLDAQTPMWKIIQEAYNVADDEERDVVRKLKYLILNKQPNPDCDNDRNSMFGRLEATHMIANDKYLLLGNEAGL